MKPVSFTYSFLYVQSTHLQFVPKRVSSGVLTEHSFAIRVKGYSEESLKSLYKEAAKVY